MTASQVLRELLLTSSHH